MHDTQDIAGLGTIADETVRDNRSDFAANMEGEQVKLLLKHFQQNIHDGVPISLSGAGIKKVSTLALQVLAAAKTCATRQNLPFHIEQPSPELVRACADTGLDNFLFAKG